MDFMQFFGGMNFEMVVFLGVCAFVVNVCDNLAILVFNEDVKNGSSLKLSSVVNFILGRRFGR